MCIARTLPYERSPDRGPPGQRPPSDIDPLDRDPPQTETSWTETPRQRPPGQRPPDPPLDGDLPVNRMTHTGVKTLPSRNFVAGGNKQYYQEREIYILFKPQSVKIELGILGHYVGQGYTWQQWGDQRMNSSIVNILCAPCLVKEFLQK